MDITFTNSLQLRRVSNQKQDPHLKLSQVFRVISNVVWSIYRDFPTCLDTLFQCCHLSYSPFPGCSLYPLPAILPACIQLHLYTFPLNSCRQLHNLLAFSSYGSIHPIPLGPRLLHALTLSILVALHWTHPNLSPPFIILCSTPNRTKHSRCCLKYQSTWNNHDPQPAGYILASFSPMCCLCLSLPEHITRVQLSVHHDSQLLLCKLLPLSFSFSFFSFL